MTDVYICPECKAGKHTNCDGVGGVDDSDNYFPCRCDVVEHPRRTEFFLESPPDHMDPIGFPDPRVIRFDDRVIAPSYPQKEEPTLFDIVADSREPLSFDEVVFQANIDFIKNEIYDPKNRITPPNDPGIRAAAFPELFTEDLGDEPEVRLITVPGLIPDLFDVEVQNASGEWVPMVPLPLYLFPFFLRRVQCHCGRKFFGRNRYQEHYAYAHILGMGDI